MWKTIRMTILLSAWAAYGQDIYSQWSSSRELRLNTSATGANIATDQIGFPILVSLSSAQADVFTGAAAGGVDLRFAKSDGSHLSYQVDFWDAAGQKAEVWVRVDTLRGNNSLQKIRMYWGNANAVDSSDGKAVFRTENGFKGVWHLGATVQDATANLNHGLDSGTVVAQDGRIGQARLFNNPESYATTGKYIYLGAKANLIFTGKITFEAWVRWNRRDNHRIILCHGGGVGYPSETVLRIGETLDYRTGIWNGTEHHAKMVIPKSDSLVWIQLTGTWTGIAWDLYRNGVKVASTGLDTNSAQNSPAGWRIGAEFIGNAISRYYSGSLDEVRLSNVSRSADWIKANYENQKVGQTLVTFGSTSAIFRNSAGWKAKTRTPSKLIQNPFGTVSLFPMELDNYDAQGRDLGPLPEANP
jgi:biopolymer transport protein ExbB